MGSEHENHVMFKKGDIIIKTEATYPLFAGSAQVGLNRVLPRDAKTFVSQPRWQEEEKRLNEMA